MSTVFVFLSPFILLLQPHPPTHSRLPMTLPPPPAAHQRRPTFAVTLSPFAFLQFFLFIHSFIPHHNYNLPTSAASLLPLVPLTHTRLPVTQSPHHHHHHYLRRRLHQPTTGSTTATVARGRSVGAEVGRTLVSILGKAVWRRSIHPPAAPTPYTIMFPLRLHQAHSFFF